MLRLKANRYKLNAICYLFFYLSGLGIQLSYQAVCFQNFRSVSTFFFIEPSFLGCQTFKSVLTISFLGFSFLGYCVFKFVLTILEFFVTKYLVINSTDRYAKPTLFRAFDFTHIALWQQINMETKKENQVLTTQNDSWYTSQQCNIKKLILNKVGSKLIHFSRI